MRREIKDHWSRVADLGCLISGRPYPTIHHCKGGSLRGIVQKGMGQKTSDWLVIPLDWEFHIGDHGIDSRMGVIAWERSFGTQVEHLDEVCRRLGYDVWGKAGIDRK